MSNFAGFAIEPMFEMVKLRPKPNKKFLRAYLSTFSKHPKSCLQRSVRSSMHPGKRCATNLNRDFFFLFITSADSALSSFFMGSDCCLGGCFKVSLWGVFEGIVDFLSSQSLLLDIWLKNELSLSLFLGSVDA